MDAEMIDLCDEDGARADERAMPPPAVPLPVVVKKEKKSNVNKRQEDSVREESRPTRPVRSTRTKPVDPVLNINVSLRNSWEIFMSYYS